jgi:hypothetical protein
MPKRRFYFLEPSKVGIQHITMIEGYLTALASSTSIGRDFDLELCASASTLAALPEALTSKIRCTRVPVMNPEKRRLIRKSLLELLVVLRWLVKLRPGDVLFVSCILPPAFWLLEYANRLLRRTGVHVVLHDEIEGLFGGAPLSFRSIGYWCATWLRSRRADSRLSLVVIDDFIRDRLLEQYPAKLTRANVSVVHQAVLPPAAAPAADGQGKAVCLVGFRTRLKWFDAIVQMASDHPSVTVLAIGGGKVENLSDGTVEPLSDKPAYFEALSSCSAAVFPYVSGYAATLSGAALDALSVGLHILALDRPFFRSLASYLGPEWVTVRSTIDELSAELDDCRLSRKAQNRAARLRSLADSKYGIAAVRRSFERQLVGPTA